MLLNKHEKKQKEALRIQRELNELYEKKRNLDWIELPKPEQRGYKRLFVLRSDIRNRHDADAIQHCLNLINIRDYCDNKEFKHKFEKKMVDKQVPGLRGLSKEQYDALEPCCKKYFYLVSGYDFLGYCLDCKDAVRYGGTFIRGPHYHFRYPWMFELEVRPHMVTHIREFDQELASAIGQLNKKAHDRMIYPRLAKIRGYRYHWERGYDDTIISLKYGDCRKTDYRKEIKNTLNEYE